VRGRFAAVTVGAMADDNPFAEPNPFSDPTADTNPFNAPAAAAPPPAAAPAPVSAAPTLTPPSNPARPEAAGRDGNPFLSQPSSRDANPFYSDPAPASAAPAASGWGAGGAFGGSGGGGAASGDKEEALRRREKDLERKQKELDRQREDLERRERELGLARGPEKNWPCKCFAIAHHDIDGDIPADLQRTVKVAYWALLGILVSLFWNFLSTCAAMVEETKVTAWLLGSIYMFTGMPGAWFLWYRPLYNAARNDSGMRYATFFVVFVLHLIFCFFAALSPELFGNEPYSMTGWLSSIEAFKKDTFMGVMYVLGATFFSVEAIFSLYVVRKVYVSFRGAGHSLASVQKDAAIEAARAQRV